MVLFNLPQKNNYNSSIYEKQSRIEEKEQPSRGWFLNSGSTRVEPEKKKLETYDDIRRMILAENNENSLKNNKPTTPKPQVRSRTMHGDSLKRKIKK